MPRAGELEPEVMSRDNREAFGVPEPVTLGLGTGELARGEDGPASPDTARETGPAVLDAASVALRFASMSFADVGMESITACRLRDSPWI